MWSRLLNNCIAIIGLGLTATAAAQPTRDAYNLSATPANQLTVAGNACGPAALLNAFRCADPNWQRASNSFSGKNDRESILKIIRQIGMRPSKHLSNRPRWNRQGVSVADLRDMGNDMTEGLFLPKLSYEIFFTKPRESPENFLLRVQECLETSLKKGFPPILSLRRYAWRKQPDKHMQWVVIDAHFVTLTSLPRQLVKHAASFTISYLDPWGGKHCEGTITSCTQPTLSSPTNYSSPLLADFPQTPVGKKLLRPGEISMLTLQAAIGRW